MANYNDTHLREKYNRDVDNAEHATDRVTCDMPIGLVTMFSGFFIG